MALDGFGWIWSPRLAHYQPISSYFQRCECHVFTGEDVKNQLHNDDAMVLVMSSCQHNSHPFVIMTGSKLYASRQIHQLAFTMKYPFWPFWILNVLRLFHLAVCFARALRCRNWNSSMFKDSKEYKWGSVRKTNTEIETKMKANLETLPPQKRLKNDRGVARIN